MKQMVHSQPKGMNIVQEVSHDGFTVSVHSLHAIHKDIKNEDLSPYQKKLRKITKSRKLVTSLEEKRVRLECETTLQ
jgi:hypothetical protein